MIGSVKAKRGLSLMLDELITKRGFGFKTQEAKTKGRKMVN
jgi:hypothetical protein